MLIRTAHAGDHPAIADLLRRCFPDENVDRLVEALQVGDTYLPDLALVAVDASGQIGDAGRLVGFVMLTTIDLETFCENGFQVQDVLCLSPLAVHPRAAGRGVARALVTQALLRADERGREPYVVLEGDPQIYSRFGFVPATRFGLVAPSERIPTPAFQVYPLPHSRSRPAGRVLYSAPFWEVVTPGLAFDGLPLLDHLEARCRVLEEALADPAAGAVPVPSCPGWTVEDVAGHLSAIHRLVLAWLAAGRRPRRVPPPPDDAGPALRFARGWRDLHARLGAEEPGAPAPTWCAYDATLGFWRRRMLHEHAIHAGDVLAALGRTWQVPDEVALDGVDEALRLWLGTRSGVDIGGRGDAVRLSALGPDGAPVRGWTVVRHAEVIEILVGEVPAEATVTAAPSELYRWVWGRSGVVHVDGQVEVVADLRAALRRVVS